jgi:hypothetical protein
VNARPRGDAPNLAMRVYPSRKRCTSRIIDETSTE